MELSVGAHLTCSLVLCVCVLSSEAFQVPECICTPKSQPTAAIPLKCCCWCGSHSAQTVRPTWEEGELCAESCASPLGSDNSTAICAIGFDVSFLLICHSLKLRASHDDWSCSWIQALLHWAPYQHEIQSNFKKVSRRPQN